MSDDAATPNLHADAPRFLAALRAAEARTFFSARLVEKDYYCSLVLRALGASFDMGLVFKGGTSLSKVHAHFFRLSEDLDFAVSIRPDARRSARRAAVEPFKRHVESLCDGMPWFRVETPLTGHDDSRQYNGEISYGSVITGERERLKIEIALREEAIHLTEERPARTLLTDPETGAPSAPPVVVRVLTIRETYAEKIRAALTRREPAIRDFFDVDNAIQRGAFALDDREFLDLVARKLAVSAQDPVDLSATRIGRLRTQIETQLRPVLRQADFEAFRLDRVVDVLIRASASGAWNRPSNTTR